MLSLNATAVVIGLFEVCICGCSLLLLANSDVDALCAIDSVKLVVGLMTGLEPVAKLVLEVSNAELGLVANVEKLDVGRVRIELVLATGPMSVLLLLLVVNSIELGERFGVAVLDSVAKIEVAVA